MHSSNPDTRDLILDLHRAIAEAQLSSVESQIIAETYLSPPTAPIRTGKRGKPSGGDSQGQIVSRVTPLLDHEHRQRHYPVRKASDSNTLARNSYWYKKVLTRALRKIDTALNYKDLLDDLPTTTLRDLQHGYYRQGSIV